jgi:hypothetical protein
MPHARAADFVDSSSSPLMKNNIYSKKTTSIYGYIENITRIKNM